MANDRSGDVGSDWEALDEEVARAHIQKPKDRKDPGSYVPETEWDDSKPCKAYDN